MTDTFVEHFRHLRFVHFVLVVICTVILLFAWEARPRQFDLALNELERLTEAVETGVYKTEVHEALEARINTLDFSEPPRELHFHDRDEPTSWVHLITTMRLSGDIARQRGLSMPLKPRAELVGPADVNSAMPPYRYTFEPDADISSVFDLEAFWSELKRVEIFTFDRVSRLIAVTEPGASLLQPAKILVRAEPDETVPEDVRLGVSHYGLYDYVNTERLGRLSDELQRALAPTLADGEVIADYLLYDADAAMNQELEISAEVPLVYMTHHLDLRLDAVNAFGSAEVGLPDLSANFPALLALPQDIRRLTFFDARSRLLAKQREKERFLTQFGVQIPTEKLVKVGAVLVAVCQFYFLLHVLSARHIGALPAFPWIGLYSGFMALIFCAFTVLVLPLTVSFSLLLIGADIWLDSGMFVIVLLLSLGVMLNLPNIRSLAVDRRARLEGKS